jgi:bifunctional non-homologous end joining protein LigD
MLLLATSSLPDSPGWLYEIKLDGYRAIGFKTGGKAYLRSRNNKDFNARYPAIAKALEKLPAETVIDGEVVALGPSGRPSFNALQNSASSAQPIYFYAFDLLVLAGRDVRSQPLEVRRELLRTKVLPKVSGPVRYSPDLEASLPDLIQSVRDQKFEGLVAKRKDSLYESGLRSGAWLKMRVNVRQEFVIGGYTPGPKNFDALIFGYYDGEKLIYVARCRNGFTPALREQVFKRFRGLQITACPFANLPEAKSGRWGVGLTKAKMKDCRWLTPELVAQVEFAEWTPDEHLRHGKFVALREDKKARDVVREAAGLANGAEDGVSFP